MARVVKRFLLHNNRENEEIKESDFDELKQDVQTVRFEVLNDLNNVKDNATEFAHMVHSGISGLNDYLVKSNQNYEIEQKFKEFESLRENFSPLPKKYGINLSITSRDDSLDRKSNISHQDSRRTLMKAELKSVAENASVQETHVQDDELQVNKNNVIVMNLNEIAHEE